MLLSLNDVDGKEGAASPPVAVEFHPFGFGDDFDDIEADFAKWKKKFFDGIKKLLAPAFEGSKHNVLQIEKAAGAGEKKKKKEKSGIKNSKDNDAIADTGGDKE